MNDVDSEKRVACQSQLAPGVSPFYLTTDSRGCGFRLPVRYQGQGIICHETLNAGEEGSDVLYAELRAYVCKEIGPIPASGHLQSTDGLPTIISCKIMRHILRKTVENDNGSLGDSTIPADPPLVDRLIEGRKNR